MFRKGSNERILFKISSIAKTMEGGSQNMPTTWTKIEKYDVDYIAGGRTANGYEYRAIIGLRKSDNSLIGGAYFYKESSAMPNTDSADPSTDFIYLNYRSEDFSNVLDMLRNEKSVWLYWTPGWNIGSLYAGIDPVGVGEHTLHALTLSKAKMRKERKKRK